MAQENKMGVMPVPKLIINMSLPLMVSLLVQSLYNIVDGIFVAKISETALTATSLAYPVQILMIAVAVGTGVGINSLLSRQLGAKKYQEAGEAAATGIILALLSSLVFIITGILAVEQFVKFFTEDAATRELCTIYLRICMIFCSGTFVETMVQRFLQASGNTFLSMVSLIVGAGANIILDPVLIFGLGGLPAMGIDGAAIATVTGQWLGAFTALWLNKKYNKEIRFAFRGYRMKKEMVLQIYKVGFPTILTQAMGSIMLSSMNAILMQFSATAVAFFGVYYKLQNFMFMPISGLGQAAIPIVGYNYGSGNKKRVKQVLKTAVPMAVGVALAGTAIFCTFPRQLLMLFSASEDMLVMGIPALRIFSITFSCLAVTTIIGFSISGLGNGVVNMLGSAIRQLIVLVPLAYLLGRVGGIEKVWYAMWASELTAMIYSVFSLKREFEKKLR